MSIKGYVEELRALQAEIKRNNARNRSLRERVKELEENIADFLSHKGQDGAKYHDTAIVVEEKERRRAKSKKQKEADVMEYLSQIGVSDPEEAYQRLLEVQRGESVHKRVVKFKKIKKKRV